MRREKEEWHRRFEFEEQERAEEEAARVAAAEAARRAAIEAERQHHARLKIEKRLRKAAAEAQGPCALMHGWGALQRIRHALLLDRLPVDLLRLLSG